MRFLSKNKYFITCCLLLVGLCIVSIYEPAALIPTPKFDNVTTAERTYNLVEYPHLSNDIIGLYNYFREVLFSQGVNSFEGIEPYIGGLPIAFGPGGDAGLRYVLAFLTYAMSEMAQTTPGYRDPSYYQNTTDLLIQKMEAPKVKEYWNKSANMMYEGKSYYQYTLDYYGVPPGDYEGLNFTNIMYRAHWILMQALYQYLFNDPKYNFTLTQQCNMLYDEMTNPANPTHRTPGVPCEPVQVFVQCNTIQSLAFKIYDNSLSTSPTDYYSAAARLLDWELDNMTNEEGLFVNGINVTKFVNVDPDYVDDFDSGYTNGWSLAFINAYNESVAQTIYPTFKSTYIREQVYPGIFGDFAFMTEESEVDPYSLDIMEFGWSLVANGFGIMCAKEMRDTGTLDKILNWMNFLFQPKWDGTTFHYPTPLFEGLEFVVNMILFWGIQEPWVTLGNFTQRRPSTFWNQSYIVDVSDPENIFINQAIYDETNTAFILTCSAAEAGSITLTNVSGGTVSSAQTSGFSLSPNGNNLTIAVERGNYNFVIEFP